jgi:hypothetical protein
MAGKKIRLAQKGSGSSFPEAGFRRFRRRALSHRVSLRRKRGDNREDFSRHFLASAPVFLPGKQGDWSEPPGIPEMI